MALDKASVDSLFRRAQRTGAARREAGQAHGLVETFPQQQGTLSRPARPRQGDRAPGPSIGGPGVELTFNTTCGQLIRLSTSDEAVSSGGDTVSWDAITEQEGFAGAAVGTDVVLPCTAIYGVELDLTKDTVTGGTVAIYLNGSLYLSLPGYTGAWSRWGPQAEEIKANAGDVLTIVTNLTSTSTVQGTLAVAGKELLSTVPTDCDEIVSGLVPAGWYKFDETSGSTAADSSGNGFDLDIAAANVTVGGAGFCCDDGSFDFAGVQGNGSNWVGWDAPTGTPFNFHDNRTFTAAIWVDLDSAASSAHLVGTLFSDVNWGGWHLSVSADIWRFRRESDGSVAGDNADAAGADRPSQSVGVPRHIVGTYDGSDMRIYVDGTLRDTTASSRLLSGSAKFMIGESRTPSASQSPLNGQVCSCQIWSRALSSAEVATLYTATRI